MMRHAVLATLCMLSAVHAAGAEAADSPLAARPNAPPGAAAAPTADAARLIRELGIRAANEPVRLREGWRPPRVILYTPAISGQVASLEPLAPGAQFVEFTADTPAAVVASADVAIGVCSAPMLAAARELRWIQWLAAGVERCVQQAGLRERQPLVTNMQRVAGPSMAEHVMGLMLVLSRHLNTYIAAQQERKWLEPGDDSLQAVDLSGKTVLVVGLGGIGTEVAQRAHAFGMRVIATRASGRSGPDYVSYVGLPDELLALTRQADFVVNCAPLTPQTTGLFNQAFFAAMKPGAYFLSVGRGRSTVTADLVAALRERRIAGAGLDVTDPEPLPADSPLWTMPNVVITPHVAANSALADEIRAAILRENLRRYVAGEAMLSVVDVGRGY